MLPDEGGASKKMALEEPPRATPHMKKTRPICALACPSLRTLSRSLGKSSLRACLSDFEPRPIALGELRLANGKQT